MTWGWWMACKMPTYRREALAGLERKRVNELGSKPDLCLIKGG